MNETKKTLFLISVAQNKEKNLFISPIQEEKKNFWLLKRKENSSQGFC